jgi:predicted Fe-S protein YdhL (DUF1289 family)
VAATPRRGPFGAQGTSGVAPALAQEPGPAYLSGLAACVREVGVPVTTPCYIPSPCIGVCRLDEARLLCEGCLRTTQEIARWPYADSPERLEILQRLRERRRAAGRTSEADSRPRRRTLARLGVA